MRNLLVAQSGGPTSAINATIAGVIMEAHASDQVDTIYGAVKRHQKVFWKNGLLNLSEKVPGEDELEILCQTPAAALGSCRVKTEKIRQKTTASFRKSSGFSANMKLCILFMQVEMIPWIQ